MTVTLDDDSFIIDGSASPFSDHSEIGLQSSPIQSPTNFDAPLETPPGTPPTLDSSIPKTDAATSPMTSRYVDRGTSPFKPGDPFVYLIIPFADASSRTESSRSGKRLRFEDPSSPVPTPGMSSKFRREDCDLDFSGGSSHGNGPLLRDSGQDLFISSILSMRTRSGEVTFRVKWSPGGYECTEKAETVLSEKTGLKNWLSCLRFKEPRRFHSILRFHPEFRSVLDFDTSSSSFVSANSASKKG